MKTSKDLELSLLIKEAHIQQLKLKVIELESELENYTNKKSDVLLFGSYGMRGSGKSYYEKLKEKDIEIERLKYYRDFIYNVIITPENWNSHETGYVLHSHTKQELYENLYKLRNKIISEMRDDLKSE